MKNTIFTGNEKRFFKELASMVPSMQSVTVVSYMDGRTKNWFHKKYNIKDGTLAIHGRREWIHEVFINSSVEKGPCSIDGINARTDMRYTVNPDEQFFHGLYLQLDDKTFPLAPIQTTALPDLKMVDPILN